MRRTVLTLGLTFAIGAMGVAAHGQRLLGSSPRALGMGASPLSRTMSTPPRGTLQELRVLEAFTRPPFHWGCA